ncbi:MAG: hypothetical protein HYV09_16980 [Deltaproteobacteria bacterium]|nr:hypothetical protein [Deltaproteobacteria bacterium]
MRIASVVALLFVPAGVSASPSTPLTPSTPPSTASTPSTYVGESKSGRKHELAPIEAAPAEFEEEPSHRWVTITWQPLQALIPLASFAVEARLASRWSASVVLGYGNAPVYVSGDRKERKPALQLGALASYYVAGSFDDGGVHVGAAAQWTRVDGDARLATGAVRPGLLLGPLVGFKWVLRGGFTLDSQIGIGFLAAEGGGAPPNDPDQKTALLGSFGIGWTL